MLSGGGRGQQARNSVCTVLNNIHPYSRRCVLTQTQSTALQENLRGKQLAVGSPALGGSLRARGAKKVTTKRTGDLVGPPNHTYYITKYTDLLTK